MADPSHQSPLRHEQVFATVHDHSNMVLIFVTVHLEYVDFGRPTNHRNAVAVISAGRSSTSIEACPLWPKSVGFAFRAYQKSCSLDRMEIRRMCRALYRNHASYCIHSTPCGTENGNFVVEK